MEALASLAISTIPGLAVGLSLTYLLHLKAMCDIDRYYDQLEFDRQRQEKA